MLQTLNDNSLNNKLSSDETNIFLKTSPFLDNQLNFDLSSHSIDLDHEKNEENIFNTDYNQSLINILENKATNF